MSVLRARCPDCRTLTAVAIGSDYQCHSCGREFAAGLVLVGPGQSDLPWPRAVSVDAATELPALLPKRPLVLAADASPREAVERAVGAPVVWIDARDPRLRDVAALERELASLPAPAGAGFSGFGSTAAEARLLTRLARALGL